MFIHVKELEFDARVTNPDPFFGRLLLEQFGGGNGELKAAMQYFVQAFAARKPYPDKYDLLMDIATEELSHLEIVGATITMLHDGINGALKDAAQAMDLNQLTDAKTNQNDMLHGLAINPLALILTGGGPDLTNAAGVPWSGAYVTANGDLTVDLRSNIAAESRAKVVYEYLLQFTEDPEVQRTLRFLMAREIAHFQQFAAALDTIIPNFPPAILQGDPRFTHMYVNASDGTGDIRGPWNEGQGPWPKGEQWDYISDPVSHGHETKGLKEQKPHGTSQTPTEVKKMEQQLGKQRSKDIKQANAARPLSWDPPK